MSCETVLEKVKTVPESCLDEISEFIDYIIFRYKEKYNNHSNLLRLIWLALRLN